MPGFGGYSAMGAGAEDGRRGQRAQTTAAIAMAGPAGTWGDSTAGGTCGVSLYRANDDTEQSLPSVSGDVLRNGSRAGGGVCNDSCPVQRKYTLGAFIQGAACGNAPVAVLGDHRLTGCIRVPAQLVGGMGLSHHGCTDQ